MSISQKRTFENHQLENSNKRLIALDLSDYLHPCLVFKNSDSNIVILMLASGKMRLT